MCELLVRTVDKSNPDDIYLDVKLTKRGDVIVIREDGWPWSEAERTSPFWKIFKMPGIKASDLSAFIAEEPGDPKFNQTLQRRAFKFDLDSYASAVFKGDIPAEITKTSDALSLKVAKPPVDDPAVFAEEPF